MPVARKPASHRLRLGRYSELGRIYLLTTNTHGRHPLFADLHLGRLVVREMREVQERGMAETLAWVLMPDHLHWLVQLQDLGLSELMRRMKSRTIARTASSWGAERTCACACACACAAMAGIARQSASARPRAESMRFI